MSTRRSARLRSSPSRSLALGAKRQRVEFDPDEAPTSGSLDGQGSVEDVATLNKDRPSNSVINSEEEYLASVMDELFDPDQTDEALVSLPTPTIPGGCQEDSISEIAPPVGPLDNNTPRVASSSVRFLARESQPVEWVKALLNKLRDNRWSVSRIVVYWLGLQGGGRGLRQKKRADQLANALLEKEDFFSSVTRHPKIQRWAMEEHAPTVVRDELDQLKTNSKVFGKFDPETSATDIKLLLDATDMVERDAPQTSSLIRRICSVSDHRFHARGRIASIVSIF